METKDWPDSSGWWWCRVKGGEGYLPGDELCVDVQMAVENICCFFILWNNSSYYADDEYFQGMEWVKASSPWSENSRLTF